MEVAKVHKERLERAGNISAQEKKKALKKPDVGESNYYRVEQINLDVLKCVFDTFVRITADDPEVLVVDPFMGSGTTALAARMVTTTHYQLLLLLWGFNSTYLFFLFAGGVPVHRYRQRRLLLRLAPRFGEEVGGRARYRRLARAERSCERDRHRGSQPRHRGRRGRGRRIRRGRRGRRLSLLVTEWAFCDEQDKLRRFSVQIVNDLNDRYIKYAYQLDRITRAPAIEELGRIYRESLREDIAWS